MVGYYKEGTLGPGMYYVMPYSADGFPGQCCSTTSLDQHNANVQALIADGREKLTPEIHFRLRNERLRRQMDEWYVPTAEEEVGQTKLSTFE